MAGANDGSLRPNEKVDTRLTERHDLQDIIIDFLNSLIDCGVSGFRFDAAKSIGLPEEGCDFWPRTITHLKRDDLILYGEVIFADYDLIDSYNRFINVLTNCDGRNRDKIFCFAKSHDSYYGYKYTTNMSSDKIALDYSELTLKYKNTLFFTRPFDDTWKSEIIKRANKANENIYKKEY